MENKNIDKFKICLNCKNFCSIYEEQVYCVVCGGKMIDKCGNCEAPIIYPTGKFCHSCGVEYKNTDHIQQK